MLPNKALKKSEFAGISDSNPCHPCNPLNPSSDKGRSMPASTNCHDGTFGKILEMESLLITNGLGHFK